MDAPFLREVHDPPRPVTELLPRAFGTGGSSGESEPDASANTYQRWAAAPLRQRLPGKRRESHFGGWCLSRPTSAPAAIASEGEHLTRLLFARHDRARRLADDSAHAARGYREAVQQSERKFLQLAACQQVSESALRQRELGRFRSLLPARKLEAAASAPVLSRMPTAVAVSWDEQASARNQSVLRETASEIERQAELGRGRAGMAHRKLVVIERQLAKTTRPLPKAAVGSSWQLEQQLEARRAKAEERVAQTHKRIATLRASQEGRALASVARERLSKRGIWQSERRVVHEQRLAIQVPGRASLC